MRILVRYASYPGGSKNGLAGSAPFRRRPVVGLDHRLARSVRLVLEGWIGGGALGLPDTTLIGALRVGRRWSVDLGVVVPVYETGSGTPFPLITIARRF